MQLQLCLRWLRCLLDAFWGFFFLIKYFRRPVSREKVLYSFGLSPVSTQDVKAYMHEGVLSGPIGKYAGKKHSVHFDPDGTKDGRVRIRHMLFHLHHC